MTVVSVATSPHVVVTGASSGIGEAVAREYLRAGARVTLVARRRQRLEAIATEFPGCTRVVEWDLANAASATGWLDAAIDAQGPVDVLVNNAGVQRIAHTWSVDVAEAEALLSVNLLSPLRLVRAVLPGMIARRSGTIVNVTSIAALAPTAAMTYYNASKGGLACASEALRGEVREHGVRVLTVYPGAIHTDMLHEGLTRYGPSRIKDRLPAATAEALAVEIRRAAATGQARLVYPRLNHLLRWFPGLTRWVLDNYTPKLVDERP